MTNNTRLITAVAFILAALGFMLPLWPLCITGIALLALSGRMVFAIGLGVLLDVAYGVPVGRFAWAVFPFTLCALGLSIVRFVASRYLLDKNIPDKLN